MSSKFLNKIKYLILPVALVSIFFLLIPDSAYAVLGTGIFDPFKKAIMALYPHFGAIVTFVIAVSIVWAIGLGLLSATTAILDYVIFKNLEQLTVHGSMVQVGWDFISGLANMLLILIFIALAFSLILKIGGLEVKKILPKLIIVALLLNFSLVFIGMAIDISNIFYNTFLPPGEDLPPDEEKSLLGVVMGPFFDAGITSFAAQWAVIGAKAAGVAVPFVGPVVMWAYIAAVPGIIFPAAMILIAQAIMFFMLNGIFFLYILIFGARIFIIQILAILSPLAFLCLILPQTKKYWDMWFKWFLGWLFVGIFLLFFLRLGFLIFGVFQEGLGLRIPWLFALGAYFTFYLFVFIYLAILIFIAKRTMPEFAAAITGVVIGIAKAKAIGAMGGAVAGSYLAKKVPGLGRGVKKWGERLEKRGKEKPGKLEKIPGWAWAERKMGAATTVLGRESAVWAESKEKKEMDELEAKMQKETTAERMSTIKTGTMDGKIAALRAAIDKNESRDVFREDEEKGWETISEDEVKAIYHKAKAKGRDLEKDIASAFPHLHEKFGIIKLDDIDKLVGRIVEKPELIKNMHPDAYDPKKAPEITKRILKEFDGRAIGEAVRSSGGSREKIEKIFEDRIKEVGFEKFAEENSSAATYLARTPARGLIRDVIHLPEEEVSKILRKRTVSPTPRETEEIKEEIAIKERQIEDLERLPDLSPEGRAKRTEARENLARLKKELKEREEAKDSPPKDQPPPSPPKTPPPPPPPKAQPQVEEMYPLEMIERQVRELLDKIKKEGGIPTTTQPFLRNYLRRKGISKEEVDKMTPKDALSKAEEILRRKE